jgi:RHS repeat-associated protein
MGIKEREWKDSSFSYRFGFNGKESDNEVSGTGNTMAFEARIFDARLGRFFSTDPWEYKYSWQTPYAYYKNSPIGQIDFLGKGDNKRNASNPINPDAKKHTVVKGDNVWNVAKNQLGEEATNKQISDLTDAIKSANNLNEKGDIQIGQKLSIPDINPIIISATSNNKTSETTTENTQTSETKSTDLETEYTIDPSRLDENGNIKPPEDILGKIIYYLGYPSSSMINPPITGTVPLPTIGAAKLVTSGLKLSKSLASASQMSQVGKVMAKGTQIRDVPRLVSTYGGKAGDWVKKTSTTFSKNGKKFETHWYENPAIGKIVEYKTKLVN